MTRALNPIDGSTERNTMPDLMVLIPPDAHHWKLVTSAHPVLDGRADSETQEASYTLRERATQLLQTNGLLLPSLVPCTNMSTVGLQSLYAPDEVAEQIQAALRTAFGSDVELKRDL